VWGFQVVHHDLWDYDVAAQPTLVTGKDGTPAVVINTKMGHVFLLNRLNGKPLLPVEERPVPRSDVPGEESWPTQPFSTISLVPERFGPEDAWGPTPADSTWCADKIRSSRSDGIFTPPSLRGTVVVPGNVGGVNWGGAAYGLLLKEISDSKLERNVFYRNTTGLLADGANRIKAIGNQFVDNGWAVKLEASTQDGSFTGNNFVGNTFDVSANNTESSTTFAGNYWDNYRGYDLNHDGLGDVPYRPVRLFSVVVAQNSPAIILLRSTFVRLLDSAEAILPMFTPEALADNAPSMRRLQ